MGDACLAECKEEREAELEVLEAIFSEKVEENTESFVSVTNEDGSHSGQLTICPILEDSVELIIPLKVASKLDDLPRNSTQHPEHFSVPLDYLPPVTINYSLPVLYPQSKRPTMTLSSTFLSESQLFHVYKKLQSISRDNAGEVTLYEFATFIHEDAMALLNITDQLHPKLSKRDHGHALPVVQEVATPVELFKIILAYDQARRQQVFDQGEHECAICLEDKPGSDCFRLSCQDVFCQACLQAHFTTKIMDGNVQDIGCPNPNCEAQALSHEIQKLVTQELFNRFDDLLLKKTLARMADVIYCPRPFCQSAVVHDDADGKVAECPACHYVFCTLCQRTSHGTNPCALNDLKRVLEAYQTASPSEREAMEKQYGDRLQQSLDELETMILIQGTSKPCPGCRALIAKTSGCNKMICTQCSRPFCWLCEASLDVKNPYAHFSAGRCTGQLFQGTEDLGPGDFEDAEFREVEWNRRDPIFGGDDILFDDLADLLDMHVFG
eukprot:m.73512 g.73512  ORF g.73512 m.73512 type:complete len:496 (-) comp14330_c0_seq2:46-1533(-)